MRSIVRSSIGRAILQILACAAGPVTCVAASAGLTLATGGTLRQAFIAAAISFAQIGVYTGIGDALGASGLQGAGRFVAKVSAHAIAGGALSVAQGGSFGVGALTGAVAGGTGFALEGSALGSIQGTEGLLARTAIAAVAGGTASVLAGGKFANGAITGAFAQLYNAEGLLGTQSGQDERAFEARTEAGGLSSPDYSFLMAASGAGALIECWQAECGIGGWAWAAAGAIPAGKFSRGLGGNPFFGKTANEIAEMLTNKGFVPKGTNPLNGQGTFLNPRTGRSYHLDLNHQPPKGPHVGINRPRAYNGPLGAKDKLVD